MRTDERPRQSAQHCHQHFTHSGAPIIRSGTVARRTYFTFNDGEIVTRLGPYVDGSA
jgi:hypothetical protein